MSEHGEPASPEAERAVLGSILLDSSKLPAASAIVRPDDFVEEVDQRIFRKVLELADRGAAVDLVTLKDALNGNGARPVSAAYLASLTDGIPDIGNVEHYARIVKEKANLRQVFALGRKIQKIALSDDESSDQVIDRVRVEIEEVERKARTTARRLLSPSEVLRHSPLRNAARVQTGLKRLDKATGGGLQIGSDIVLSGAPGSGKTTLAIQIALAAQKQLGARIVGFFGDEGLEAAAIRIGQQIGLRDEDLEAGDKGALDSLAEATLGSGGGTFEFISPDEGLEETLARLRRDGGGPWVFVLDNLQGCNFEIPGDGFQPGAKSERERLTVATRKCRKAARETPALVLVVSEASRGAYASRDPEKRTAALASGAETRAIEYQADVVLHLSELREGVVKMEVAKNRPGRGRKPTIFLRHDRERACYAETDPPSEADERAEKVRRQEDAASEAAQKKLRPAMAKLWPLSKAKGLPGVSKKALADEAGLRRDRLSFHHALRGLTDGQGEWDGPIAGPNRGDYYRPRKGQAAEASP